ncbi:UDP-2,3-diacylglucosamine diphosphatase [Aureispira anguillae]|uniref:UDP-2,3-diacylglucosamine diphosphatase n=1 Tax=Aureispira anguillae TaxID=2864201 RepID=A0A916DRF9_9BACT|nr:UDP-2,3-diacylglucosamine diphosphatase [Aureispira anguillae]BDS11814.1 UDP-2,3-diacylglucosamine diphosphatase [Aureispira anguillae]
MAKRKLDVLVLSDIHLGTYGCHATELVNYLKSVKPKILVLNGDIIDIWQFKKSYFPKPHLAVISQIVKMASKGTKVYYLTGNHDEMLRKFVPMQMGNFYMDNKLLLELDGKVAWFFHGDVFDTSVTCAKWLAKLGGAGYDALVAINLGVNYVLKSVGKPRMSLSKKVKDSVKRAVKYVKDFETVAAELAIEKSYDYVVLGHIHQPQIRSIATHKGQTTYLNSGDWIENLTALEYVDKKWSIYQYSEVDFEPTEITEEIKDINYEMVYASVTEGKIDQIFKELILQ